MRKAVLSGSFGFDDQVASLVPLHKTSVDRAWLQKRASAKGLFDFDKITPNDNETLVHLLALGDGETIGANRNGDYFPKAANQKYHKTFLTAHYFHNHDNDDPKKAYGRVVAAAYNEPMGRVELVVGLDNDKCREDLQKLASDGSFPVSMSCTVPNDVCSICGNVAKTRSEYCKHASAMMGKILDDGRQVYVVNHEPSFFDISKVYRGADRIAYTFRQLDKAASEGRVLGGAELAAILDDGHMAVPVKQSAFTLEKTLILQKMAEILDDAEAKDLLNGFRNALQPQKWSDDVVSTLKSASDKDAVMSALHAAGVCLPIDVFVRVVGIEKPAGISDDAIKAHVRAIIKCAEDPTVAETLCNNGSYDGDERGVNTKVAAVISGLRRECGLLPEFAYGRLIKGAASNSGQGVKCVKSAGFDSPQTDVIAKEYVSYLASFAREAARHSYGHDGFIQNLTALHAVV